MLAGSLTAATWPMWVLAVHFIGVVDPAGGTSHTQVVSLPAMPLARLTVTTPTPCSGRLLGGGRAGDHGSGAARRLCCRLATASAVPLVFLTAMDALGFSTEVPAALEMTGPT